MAQLSKCRLLHNTTVQYDGVTLHNHPVSTTYNNSIWAYRHCIKSGVSSCSHCHYVNVMQNDGDDDDNEYDDDNDNVT
jgi:hypothetical protein